MGLTFVLEAGVLLFVGEVERIELVLVNRVEALRVRLARAGA